LAADSGLTIEFIQRKSFRKEDRIQDILRIRGAHPGLVHIFSAMEPCSSFKPWYNKQTGQTYLRSSEAKALLDIRPSYVPVDLLKESSFCLRSGRGVVFPNRSPCYTTRVVTSKQTSA
jgi:hypothetical protein